MKRILKLAVFGIAAIAAFSSCSKNEDVPSQKDIETKIIGKWKQTLQDGTDIVTNNKIVKTFYSNHAETESSSRYFNGVYIWFNKAPFRYEVKGNELTERSEETSMMMILKVTSIDETELCDNGYKCITPEGKEISKNINATYQKVTADYSQDIIGMWEGVEMTGEETYGDANHRIYYKEDGTYTYYDKVGDSWVPSKNAGNEYNVDGDWLATRWQPTEGADYEYEWWDIDEIKDGTMKWSALRENGDKTRYTTTFTWKKVNFPTQEEIETKIIGKWKQTIKDGEGVLTNDRLIKTFFTNHEGTSSSSRSFFGEYVWCNKIPIKYEIKGNDLCEKGVAQIFAKVISIDESRLYENDYKIITHEGEEISVNTNLTYEKVTADYSEAIIGLWEGVEMTGEETYGDANHRIEYKADGTYVYYDKDGDDWKLSEDVDNEYNVDGDWLASRWRPKAGEDFEYEWWDIDEIKDGTMKWSALREKDNTRYTTTFTWKKVNLPTQEDIETKIIGKWKQTIMNGTEVLTNHRLIKTYFTNQEGTHSTSTYFFDKYVWYNKISTKYEIKGNDLCETVNGISKAFAKVLSIDESKLYENDYKIITPESKEETIDCNFTFQKVTADYSQDIIGMWEGVEMTGDETYGDANHRIYYKEDGTYTYYDKVGDSWVPSKNAGNEYNVDGDWLATRWQPTEGADYEYEWWDIVEIKDGTMKWSALREKGDGTRYTTTFTWKKIQ